MEILIACVLAFYVVKNGVVDTAYAVRGKPSPRQQMARQLLESRRTGTRRTGDSALGRYARQLWDDSWDEARQRHLRRRDKRRMLRIERKAGQRPSGAARRYLGGVKRDLWARWDRGWDNANAKRHERRMAGHAERTAAAIIAAARPQSTWPPAVDQTEAATPEDATGSAGGTAGQATPVTAPQNEHTIPREEPVVTITNGETTTLSQTLSAIQAWETSTQEAITSLEASIASLQGAEVGVPVVGPLAKAQEAFSQALAAFQSARDGLNPSVQIGDMYQSSPDAGTKTYVTS
jgi:hypothetical protein